MKDFIKTVCWILFLVWGTVTTIGVYTLFGWMLIEFFHSTFHGH